MGIPKADRVVAEIRALPLPIASDSVLAVLSRGLQPEEVERVLRLYAEKMDLDVPFVGNQEHYSQLVQLAATEHLPDNTRVLSGVIRSVCQRS